MFKLLRYSQKLQRADGLLETRFFFDTAASNIRKYVMGCDATGWVSDPWISMCPLG